MDAVDENRNRKRVNDQEVLESLHVREFFFPKTEGTTCHSSPLLGLSKEDLTPSSFQVYFIKKSNCRSVSSTSHTPGVTNRGSPCLREEVEVVSRPKGIQWTRIETGNELMT
ncbi:hypothetical protein CEXT_390481 [Caerostris extrusa]|uniref:Uncharacterized protein n=1 Tax=Caerostris extrusa TaxID=172846 RepID=A0AAV4V0G7_CAEEX|nr:hypothetical protein CEXT_390481 [Caerostris extrusa]